MIKQFYLIHTTPGQGGPESNGDEGVLYIPQSSKTGASPSDAVYHQNSRLYLNISTKIANHYIT